MINKNFKESLKELKDHKFDVIIFSYSIHHLPIKDQILLLNSLLKNLNNNGIIIIGDVMTSTNNEMTDLSLKYSDIWDDDEYYPTLQNYNVDLLKQNYNITFEQVTFCSGILILNIKN